MPAPRYNFQPLAGRSSIDINMENADEARQRRVNANIANPGMLSVLPDPMWDPVWGGIDRQKQSAEDSGMGFSADLSGLAPRSSGGGTGMDPWGAPSNPNQLAARAAAAASSDDADKFHMQQASLRILQAQARMAEDQAFEADWKNDPTKLMEDTKEATQRQGVVNTFQRGERVADQGNTAAEYAAGAPTRRAQEYDQLQQARTMYPFGKEAGDIEKARIESGAKVREAETNRAREGSQAMRSFADLAKVQAGQPQQVPDPTGAREGGFFGIGDKPHMVQNPAYENLGDAMDMFRGAIGQDSPPTGKVMSRADLAAYAQQNRMSPDEAGAMAARYGWTIR